MKLAFTTTIDSARDVGYMLYEDWQKNEASLNASYEFLVDVLDCTTKWEATRHARELAGVPCTTAELLRDIGTDYPLACEDCENVAFYHKYGRCQKHRPNDAAHCQECAIGAPHNHYKD